MSFQIPFSWKILSTIDTSCSCGHQISINQWGVTFSLWDVVRQLQMMSKLSDPYNTTDQFVIYCEATANGAQIVQSLQHDRSVCDILWGNCKSCSNCLIPTTRQISLGYIARQPQMVPKLFNPYNTTDQFVIYCMATANHAQTVRSLQHYFTNFTII